MNINGQIPKSDIVGALASILCLAHCIATPFFLIWYTNITLTDKTSLWWWSGLDLMFLVISFLAVYFSTKNTSKNWVRIVLWISWLSLTIAIINEKFSILPLGEIATYIPTISLAFFHLYNRKYCTCKEEHCCVE